MCLFKFSLDLILSTLFAWKSNVTVCCHDVFFKTPIISGLVVALRATVDYVLMFHLFMTNNQIFPLCLVITQLAFENNSVMLYILVIL